MRVALHEASGAQTASRSALCQVFVMSSPVVLHRNMARIAPSVFFHAAPHERCLSVRDHSRIAAKHNLRGLRRERDARGLLQTPLLEGGRNAPWQGSRYRLPAHEGDGAHLLPVLAHQPRYGIAVGELLG